MFSSGLGSLTWSDANSWLEFASLIRLNNFIIEVMGAQTDLRLQTKIITIILEKYRFVWLGCLIYLINLYKNFISLIFR